MGLESLVCENCGGHLIADPQNSGMMKCESCRRQYKIKANDVEVNNYTADTIHADVINIVDDDSREAKVQAAESSMSLGNYDDAAKIFYMLTKEHANDYRGWLGLVKVDSQNFSKMPVPKTLLTTMEVNFENARKIARMANAKELKRFEKDVETYFSLVKQANKNEIALQKKRIVAAQSSIPEHEKKHELAQNDYKNQIEKYESEIKKINFSFKIYRILAYVLIIIAYIIFLIGLAHIESDSILLVLFGLLMVLGGWIIIAVLGMVASKLLEKLRYNRVAVITKKISQRQQEAEKETVQYNSTVRSLKNDISDAGNMIDSLGAE